MIQLAVYLAAAALALAWIWLPQVRCLPFGHEPTTGLFILPPDLGDVWLGLEARPRCAHCGALVVRPASLVAPDVTGIPVSGASGATKAAATAMARPRGGSRKGFGAGSPGTAARVPSVRA